MKCGQNDKKNYHVSQFFNDDVTRNVTQKTDGKAGIVYVKQHNGTTYYLEQIRDGNLLQNKQMIKTSTGTIPKIDGLYDAIDKKWGISSAPDKSTLPRMYVQDVWSNAPTDTITQSETVVNQDASTGIDTSGDFSASQNDGFMLPTAEEAELEQKRQKAMQAATTELERTAILYGVSRATFERVQRISQILGREVLFYWSDVVGENGFFDNDTGILYVNAKSKNPVAQIIAHELTHSIEKTVAYDDLRSTVLMRIQDTGGDLRELRQAKIDSYKKKGIILTPEGADKELVAAYIETHLLTDEQSIRQLVRKKRNIGEYILSWIDKILSKFGNSKSQERLFLTKARKYYAEALSQTDSTTETSNANNQQSDDLMQRTMDMMQFSFSPGEITAVQNDINKEFSDNKQYSISEISGEKGNYGIGVILDTNLFDGVNSRNWSKVLGKFVYDNFAGAELTMYDYAGNPETVYLARENDRVKKDGANNSYKVLDKLAGYRGNITRAKAIVLLDEVLATSKYKKSTDEHKHQWLDEGGWEIRTTYLQDRNGNIYEATVNIANSNRGRILYDVSRVHWIDKKSGTGENTATGESQRSRHQEPRAGGSQSEATKGSITEANTNVNRYNIGTSDEDNTNIQFSFSEPRGEKQVDSPLDAWYNEETEISEGGVNYGRGETGKDVHRRISSILPGKQDSASAGANRTDEERIYREGRTDRIGGEGLDGRDSEGRRLTEEQLQRLQGTVITDETGAPIVLYHFTPEMDFETFSEGDIGFHFGTRDQATQRGKDLNAKSGRMFRVCLNIKNPYRVRLDLNSWYPSQLGLYLWSEGVLTDEQWNELQNLEGYGYDTPGAKRLREMLAEIGIDCIKLFI